MTRACSWCTRWWTRPRRRSTYQDELKNVEDRLTHLGIDFEIKSYMRGNNPAEDMLEAAEDEGADLIVIGIRRRSPVGKLVMGSNAQTVLLNANCAVLAVEARVGLTRRPGSVDRRGQVAAACPRRRRGRHRRRGRSRR